MVREFSGLRKAGRGTECGLLLSYLLGDTDHFHNCTVCFFGWWYLPQVYEQCVICYVLSKLFVGWGGSSPASLLEFSPSKK